MRPQSFAPFSLSRSVVFLLDLSCHNEKRSQAWRKYWPAGSRAQVIKHSLFEKRHKTYHVVDVSDDSSNPVDYKTGSAHVEQVHTNERVPGHDNYYEKDGLRTYGDDMDHEHEPKMSFARMMSLVAMAFRKVVDFKVLNLLLTAVISVDR